MSTSTEPKLKVRRTHLSLFVKDPVASAAWYADVLGMKETARGPQWVMMSFGPKHHDIALIQAAIPEGTEELRGPINMQHYGLEIDGDMTELRRLYGMLLKKNVPIVKTTDHLVGVGVYFTDPDGHRLEFFCEVMHDDEEAQRAFGEHHGPSDPITLDPIFD